MKKVMLLAMSVMTVGLVMAAPMTTRKAGATVTRGAASAGSTTEGSKKDKVMIERYPRLGQSCLLGAPSLPGGSAIGPCYTKARPWIVLETKYQTTAKTVDRLTFTWHVVLETAKATNKDKDARQKLAPYSYFTTSTSYVNIPRGSHAASVCLHPSYLETFGEPVAVAVLVSDAEGTILDGDVITTMDQVFKKAKGYKFWEDDKVMNAKLANGEPVMEQRQGLQERSKTIWALVNPNDYEMVAQ